MLRQRATKKWLLFFIAALVICSIGPSRGPTAKADSPSLSIQICRVYVAPCQNEVSIPEDGTAELDLVLSATNLNTGSNLIQIAAWETHFRLSDTSVAELVPDMASGRPVQQQGDSDLALEGLFPLQTSGGEDRGQFFTVQNQFDSESGKMDYSVTLVGYDPAKPGFRVLPFSSGAPLHLGRITMSGVTKGISEVSPEAASSNPLQIVVVDPMGGLGSVTAMPLSANLATIKTGNVATAELQGQIIPPGTTNDLLTAPFPIVLTVTIWRSGAIPQWRGGNDLPLVIFREVVTDAAGTFRVIDIAPSLLPPGTYDLRIASPGTLPNLVQGVTIPAPGSPGNSPPVLSISIIGLREGDIDGNNSIDQADLDALKASFARLGPDSGFNANADFNGDGVVDVLDFARLAQNFGKKGD